jgi:sugar phosphate isomerase/epimerase
MIPALFSVSYAGLWGQAKLSLEGTCRKAAELGFSAIEIMGKRPHLSVVDYGLDEVRSLKRTCDELGLEVASVAAYTNFTGGLESREVPFVEIQLAYINRLAGFAELLGAKLVRVFTGYSTGLLSYEAQWHTCVEALREACDIAASYGACIGVQNHHDIGVGVESYVDLLDQIDRPNCRAMFDAWSAALQGADLYAWAKRLAPRMAQTTVADYVRRPRYRLVGDLVNYERMTDVVCAVPVGEGFIDYAAFFRGLREGGFDGYVAYEMCSPVRGGGSLSNLDATAAQSLSAISAILAQ